MKNNNFLMHFKHMPIGLTGLGLGVGGLGNLYAAIFKEHVTNNVINYSIIQVICTTITIIFLILILLRNLAHKKTFTNEIKHPLLSSFIPTICMSTMVVAGFFGVIGDMINYGINGSLNTTIPIASSVFKGIGIIIWYLAVLGHLIFFSMFIYHVFLKHDTKNNNLFASWFVPPVGIIVACTVVGSFNGLNWIPNIFAQIIWYFGFILYLIAFPFITYKLIVHKDLTRSTLPSFAIYGAPANLSLVGFITIFKDVGYYPDIFKTIIIGFLTILGLLTTLTVYIMFFWIFKIKFNPTYASLTFPLAIGATSIFKSSTFFASKISVLGNILEYISYVETTIATIIICFVLVRMILLIFTKIKESNKEKTLKK